MTEPITESKPDVISILNQNISLEHGAIVQYLLAAYAMGESGTAAEVINIARTEMRHLKMFGDLLVDLGGEIDILQRGPMELAAGSAAQLMRNGVAAEEMAIRAYTDALDRVDHLGAQRIIERVLADERFHLSQFSGFVAEVGEVEASFPPVPQSPDAARIVDLLNPAVGDAYRALLFNVREYLSAREFKHRDRTLEPMIWAMKHLGLLADEISERGGTVALLDSPEIPPQQDPYAATLEMVASEERRCARFVSLMQDLVPTSLQALLTNLSAHNRYDAEKLRAEAERLKTSDRDADAGRMAPETRSLRTVGSLLGQEQA